MLPERSPLAVHRAAMQDGSLTTLMVAEHTLAHANGNASHNSYLYLDAEALRQRALGLEPGSPLYGVPFSLKDCFDLAGTVTTAGSRFYAQTNAPAEVDSEIAARLQAAGALIPGKTHLHPLAYGITGENLVYGDCVQPRDASLLTGGSSSGAVASVQEGSALAAIGTDTGGSVRVPAALGGLVGYRASHAIRHTGIWRGGMHLAPSFDTPGFLLRDPRDVAPIAEALFGITAGTVPSPLRVGVVPLSFLHDSEPVVVAAFEAWKQRLTDFGAELDEFDADFFGEAVSILVPVQAHEAGTIHQANLDALAEELDPAITQRLRWGASLSDTEVAGHRARMQAFRAQMAGLLARFHILLIPCAPFSRLLAGADHTDTRAAIIRYTAPVSITGLPVLTMPGELLDPALLGTDVQLAAAQSDDAMLLALSTALGKVL